MSKRFDYCLIEEIDNVIVVKPLNIYDNNIFDYISGKRHIFYGKLCKNVTISFANNIFNISYEKIIIHKIKNTILTKLKQYIKDKNIVLTNHDNLKLGINKEYSIVERKFLGKQLDSKVIGCNDNYIYLIDKNIEKEAFGTNKSFVIHEQKIDNV